MSVQTASSGTLTKKKLNGIYWKTFVGFVNKNDQKSSERNESNYDDQQERPTQLHKRERSFEYMELTARDTGWCQSETESSSTENSLTDANKDEGASSMYAILDMGRKKEIQITDEVAVFEGSPIRSFSSVRPVTLTFSNVAESPKCSPILPVGLVPNDAFTPSPIPGNSLRVAPLNDIDKDEVIFSDQDEVPFEADSFDRLELSSPSMEPAPWKEQCLSIQRWMIPHVLPDNEDEFMALPDAVPTQDYEYCHYVPSLEVILEESGEEEYDDFPLKFRKPSSLSEDMGMLENQQLLDVEEWKSAKELSKTGGSQDDLFSITSTCGSLGSMRRIGTFENLTFDEEAEDESDGSSDDLDRPCDDVTIREEDLAHETHELTIYGDDHENELSVELFPEKEPFETQNESNTYEDLEKRKFLSLPDARSDISSNASSSQSKLDSSRETIPASSVQSLLDSASQSSGRGSPDSTSDRVGSEHTETRSNSPGNAPGDSGVDDVTSEPPNEMTSASSKADIDYESPEGSEIDIPGLPKELYFDSRDIPKIVVMFAQEELAKERKAKEAQLGETGSYNGDMIQYRKRSSTYDPDAVQDSAYSSHEGVQRGIHQIKASDVSRISTLSSSTPELSVMTEDALPYIPVSYASEAAAKKKKKRRATMSAGEASNRRRATARAPQTKALISGTGFGNGFSSLRRKFRSRKAIGSSLRRSQSEKPQISHSSPDISGPMARFLNSPRRRPKEKIEAPPKVEGRRRGFRSVVSGIFRRLSNRFTSQNTLPSHDVQNNVSNDVIEKTSPSKSSLGVVREESSTSESVSVYSSARESVVTSSSTDKRPSPQRVRSVLGSSRIPERNEDFRQRSFSVPVRPRSRQSPYKFGSGESDVFESLQSVDDNSLDKTIYV